MNSNNKNRASRNRTLTISDKEIKNLRDHILYINDIDSNTNYINKLINADLFDVIDGIPDFCANLIIIDPPYNLSKKFNSTSFEAISNEDYDLYIRSWFSKVCRKLAPNGSLYMCGDWKCSYIQQRIISEHLTILNRITWQREKGRGANSNWKNSMEDIWFAVNSPKNYYFDVNAVKMKRRVIAPYRVNGKPKDWEATDNGKIRVTYPSNFWDDISIPFWSMPENTDHPTQKSEKLIAKIILASSKSGDLIFDPFVGSGTTCVVAKKLGRQYIGIEIDEEYCMLGAKRLIQAETDTEIQGYKDGFFWERNSLDLQKNIKSSVTTHIGELFNH